jgi:hypothetical protein
MAVISLEAANLNEKKSWLWGCTQMPKDVSLNHVAVLSTQDYLVESEQP